jgi:hypothetical protein
VFEGCNGIYLIHAWFYFRSRNIRLTLFLLGVFVLLLIRNVSGCRGDVQGLAARNLPFADRLEGAYRVAHAPYQRQISS